MSELNQTWEEKVKETQRIQQEREKMLEDLGITIEKNSVGLYSPRKVPHLVNLSEDPLMSECLVYQIRPGKTRVGRLDENAEAEIKLSGNKIRTDHCYFMNENGKVTLHPGESGGTVMVNGLRIEKPKRLRSGYRIILGDNHIFRFNNPEEARKQREKKAHTRNSTMVDASNLEDGAAATAESEQRQDASEESETTSLTSEVVDWNYARREARLGSVAGSDAGLADLDIRSDMGKSEFEVQIRNVKEEMEARLAEQRKEYEERRA
jgi:kinesin family protein 1